MRDSLGVRERTSARTAWGAKRNPVRAKSDSPSGSVHNGIAPSHPCGQAKKRTEKRQSKLCSNLVQSTVIAAYFSFCIEENALSALRSRPLGYAFQDRRDIVAINKKTPRHPSG
jgi:hypothetical protein